jgi:hypothetical protein
MIQIDRLRVMANEAILEYQSALIGGSEPPYPEWADDLLLVCERAETAIARNASRSCQPADQKECSFSAA